MSNFDTVIDFGSKNLRLGAFDQTSKNTEGRRATRSPSPKKAPRRIIKTGATHSQTNQRPSQQKEAGGFIAHASNQHQLWTMHRPHQRDGSQSSSQKEELQ